MIKEKLLKHWIEQVEKAGYHVIPKDRVERIGAQYSYDLNLEKTFHGPGQLHEWHERNLLLSMAYELGKVVRWSENTDEERGLRILRAILTVIKPKLEKEHEVLRSVPRFTDALGRYAGPLSLPEAQGRAKGSIPGAG